MDNMNGKELFQQISQSADIPALRRLKTRLADVQGIPTDTINIIHDMIIRKTLTIAEQRVEASYADASPLSSFVLILLGSGGRKEQTLWSDQDHGLIYELKKNANPQEGAFYSELLARHFQQSLEDAGYPPCGGNVLSTNPEWRKTVEDWNTSIGMWIAEPEFNAVRNLLVLADARPIYGNAALASELGKQLHQAINEHRRTILPRMLQNTLRYKVLVGWLGNWLTEPYGHDAGGIDIKYGAYLPMVNAVRLLALMGQVGATSTLERIEGLKRCNLLDRNTAANLKQAVQFILELRSTAPRGHVFVRNLPKQTKRELRRSLGIGRELQKMVKRMIGMEGRGS